MAKALEKTCEIVPNGHKVADASPQAIALWHAFEKSLDGTLPWGDTKRLYDLDAKQPWFQYSLMPDLGISIPPPPSKIAGLRRFVTFDPTHTLLSVSSTPTLALYGALDRNVEADDSAAHLCKYLRRAGDGDVTIKMYPNAGHQLIVSKSGYNGDPTPPERYVPDYPPDHDHVAGAARVHKGTHALSFQRRFLRNFPVVISGLAVIHPLHVLCRVGSLFAVRYLLLERGLKPRPASSGSCSNGAWVTECSALPRYCLSHIGLQKQTMKLRRQESQFPRQA